MTLGIIGVVAALTLPAVINKYREKQLEAAFKKSFAVISSALNAAAYDFGYDSITDINNLTANVSVEDTSNFVTSNMSYFEEINNSFLSHFNKITKLTQDELDKKNIKVKNFAGNEISDFDYDSIYGVSYYQTPYAALYYLTDGTVVSSLTFFYHGKYDGVTLTFDTNGPYRGPNRYGYDIFIYNTGTWNQNNCTKQNADNGNYNSRTCYMYALQDVNPDDKTKSYWKSLY